MLEKKSVTILNVFDASLHIFSNLNYRFLEFSEFVGGACTPYSVSHSEESSFILRFQSAFSHYFFSQKSFGGLIQVIKSLCFSADLCVIKLS